MNYQKNKIKNYHIIFIVILLFTFIISCKKENTEELPLSEPDYAEELSGGALGTTFDFTENAFGQAFSNLSNSQLNDFAVGNSFFRNNWVTAPSSTTARDGLGPLFNAMSCGGCHNKDGRSAPPSSPTGPLNGLLFRLSIQGISPDGGPLDHPHYGGQLNNRSILAIQPEGYVSVSYTEISGNYPDGTTYSLRQPIYVFQDLAYGDFENGLMFSPRIANQVMGLGLLENVSESTILEYADESDQNGDGISGRPNYVWNVELQQNSIGRFGWKANQPSLKQQTAAAFVGDIGITSPLFVEENSTSYQTSLFGQIENGGNPEISAQNLDRVVFYMQALAVPARRNAFDSDIQKGKNIFNEIKCSSCHRPEMRTETHSITQLSNQVIRSYSDMLLHDMGNDLADNRTDFLASGNEWRTPPLWGIGLIPTVNGHSFLLHDGRARNVEEAILWHGGEAENSKVLFKNLSEEDRNFVIRFINSL
jgi:CxxC motif-containing protein (DUF1111 family)